MITGDFKATLTSSWGELASLPCRSLSSFPDQWRHAHLRKHQLDFESSFPPAAESFRAKLRSGWSGGVGLSPGSGRWPSDLKVSARPRLPEDTLGVTHCHAGGLQRPQSNRRRNHMLVTFLENVIVHVGSPSHCFQISWASLNKREGKRLCIFVRPSWLLTLKNYQPGWDRLTLDSGLTPLWGLRRFRTVFMKTIRHVLCHQ